MPLAHWELVLHGAHSWSRHSSIVAEVSPHVYSSETQSVPFPVHVVAQATALEHPKFPGQAIVSEPMHVPEPSQACASVSIPFRQLPAWPHDVPAGYSAHPEPSSLHAPLVSQESAPTSKQL
jgi:hypothetical protein